MVHRNVLAVVATALLVTPSEVAASPPVNCQVSDWVATSQCDGVTPVQYFQRTITTQPAKGGKACPVLTKKENCKPTPCKVSDWGPWDVCMEDGTKTRTRTIVSPPLYKGTACPPLSQSIKCSPNDCLVSAWSPWTCDASNNKVRTRHVTRDKKTGGCDCPPLQETAPGGTFCVVPCVLEDDWTKNQCLPKSYGSYSKDVQTNIKNVKVPAKNGGTCPTPTDPLRYDPSTTVCYCEVTDPLYEECMATMAKTDHLLEDNDLGGSWYSWISGTVLDVWHCVKTCDEDPDCVNWIFWRPGSNGDATCVLSHGGTDWDNPYLFPFPGFAGGHMIGREEAPPPVWGPVGGGDDV